jgi:ankyrin repeat protein
MMTQQNMIKPFHFLPSFVLILSSVVIAAGQNSPIDVALRQSAQDGDLIAVKAFIADGANVNSRDKTGRTALLWVAPARDNPEMVKLLFEHGADVNISDNEGESALMIAASQSNPGIMTALIKAGAKVNAQNRKGETALMAAAARANVAEIKILLANGADLNLRDKKNRLASDVARAGSRNYSDDENKRRFAETFKLLKSSAE